MTIVHQCRCLCAFAHLHVTWVKDHCVTCLKGGDRHDGDRHDGLSSQRQIVVLNACVVSIR